MGKAARGSAAERKADDRLANIAKADLAASSLSLGERPFRKSNTSNSMTSPARKGLNSRLCASAVARQNRPEAWFMSPLEPIRRGL